MEKQTTTFAACSQQTNSQTVSETVAMAASIIAKKMTSKWNNAAEWLRNYYSGLLEQPLTLHQTGLLVQAQVAFMTAALPISAPALFRLAATVWLVAVLLKCKKEI